MTKDEQMSKAVKDLIIRDPFYGLFLTMINKYWGDKHKGISISTACVIYFPMSFDMVFNEEYWSEQNPNVQKGILKHECLHIIHMHNIISNSFIDKKLFNIAADLEINQYIEDECIGEGWQLLSNYPELNLPVKAGTKVYYELLKKDLEEDHKSERLQNLYDAMNQGDKEFEGYVIPNHIWEELSESEKSLLKKQIESKVQEIADDVIKSRGTIPREINSFISKIALPEPPKFDWKGYLRRFVGGSNNIYTKKLRKKDSKRYPNNPGLKIKKKSHVMLAIDTSGSVSTEELNEFFAEIDHIYNTGVEITVVQCDAAISNIAPYKKGIDIRIHGRGGRLKCAPLYSDI